MIYWSNCQFFVNAAAGFVCERDEPEEFIKIDLSQKQKWSQITKGGIEEGIKN